MARFAVNQKVPQEIAEEYPARTVEAATYVVRDGFIGFFSETVVPPGEAPMTLLNARHVLSIDKIEA